MDHPKARIFGAAAKILAALILVSSALHVAYLVHDCPLDLAPDEAHYWDWSRHLDWSYYSKGPLIALLIRGSCDLVGTWSEALTGDAGARRPLAGDPLRRPFAPRRSSMCSRCRRSAAKNSRAGGRGAWR